MCVCVGVGGGGGREKGEGEGGGRGVGGGGGGSLVVISSKAAKHNQRARNFCRRNLSGIHYTYLSI